MSNSNNRNGNNTGTGTHRNHQTYQDYRNYQASRNPNPQAYQGRDEIELPHDFEIERAALATAIMDESRASAYRLVGSLTPAHFFRTTHRYVFEAIESLLTKQLDIDPMTIHAELSNMGRIEHVGGMGAIAALLDGLAATKSVPSYIEVLQEKYAKRQQYKIALQMMHDSGNDDMSSNQVTERVQTQLREILNPKVKGLRHIAPIVADQLAAIEKGEMGKVIADYLPTGFRDLDCVITGLARGSLTILAARPSVGKTSMATSLALNMAGMGYSVAFFTMEMSAKDFAARAICGEAWVDAVLYLRSVLTEAQRQRLKQGYEKMKEERFYLDDQRQTVNQMLGRCLSHKAQHGLDAVFVDYLQITHPSDTRAKREQQVARIAEDLKEMAMILNVPVIALAQLNREGDAYERPNLSNLRESGAIEQVADGVWFLYRLTDYDDSAEYGSVAAIIEKNRNGPVHDAEMFFLKRCTRFVEKTELDKAKVEEMTTWISGGPDLLSEIEADARLREQLAMEAEEPDNDMPF